MQLFFNNVINKPAPFNPVNIFISLLLAKSLLMSVIIFIVAMRFGIYGRYADIGIILFWCEHGWHSWHWMQSSYYIINGLSVTLYFLHILMYKHRFVLHKLVSNYTITEQSIALWGSDTENWLSQDIRKTDKGKQLALSSPPRCLQNKNDTKYWITGSP